MNSPAELLHASTLFFLIGLALVFLYRALSGGLRLRGLLDEEAVSAQDPLRFSPARAQLLVIISLSALQSLTWGALAQDRTSSLRVVIVIALIASNLIYLRSKILHLGFPHGRPPR